MNPIIQKTIFHLAGTSDPNNVSVETARQLVQQYPYFAPARFMLATVPKEKNDTFTQEAALFFSNPTWFHALLHDEAANQSPGFHHFANDPESLKVTVENIAIEEFVEDIEPDLEQITPVVDNKITSMLQEQAIAFKKPVAEDARLDIEAVKAHTIDYFASLGIKIDLNNPSQDPLSVKLFKFTDWLKQIRPKQGEPDDLGTDSELEEAVLLIAQNSNQSREIVTETMAEVLVKQGQVNKAIQLFIKLSFINPEKSAYFASRIEQLKGL